MSPHRYFVIHKPRKMVSQFVSTHRVKLLGDLGFDFPEGIHAVGRLDNNSEGLLILTTNKKVTRLLFEGEVPHTRTYVVLVNGIVGAAQLHQLRTGIPILDKDGSTFNTSPCEVDIIEKPTYLYDDRFIYRERGDNTWLQITLTEGRYHQVRKMVDAVGHQCKRLIRTAIEAIELGAMPVGSVREIEEELFFELLRIVHWR